MNSFDSGGMHRSASLRDWLAGEPFTLVMSSGFFSFFAHCGIVSVLEEEGLTPEAVAGSSAGALTGGLWAAGLPAQEISEFYCSMDKAAFWDPAPGPGFLRGRLFRQMLRRMSPAARIEDCRIPVSVSAFDLLRFRVAAMKQGDFADVIYASCAVPFMFRPIRIGRGYFVDGGVADRPGLAGVPPGTRVFYHHIATRSPWRRANSSALRVPERSNMISLVVRDLPRPGPNALELGREAWEMSRAALRQALDRPVTKPVIEVDPTTGSLEPAAGMRGADA